MMRDIIWKNNESEKMRIHEKNKVVYLTFPALDSFDFIRHGFSSRYGGVSEGYFSEMNLSFTRGDQEDHVMENYRRIADAIGFSLEDIVCSDQTHTTNIREVGLKDRGKGILCPRDYTDIDGFVTNAKGPVLATSYADCVPVYLVDPKNKAVALLHSGWRGTVNNIAGKAVLMLQEKYESAPEDLVAAIGPSICQDCYEISEDVAEKFKATYTKDELVRILRDDHNGKYHLNLWEAVLCNLRKSGLAEENIHLPNLCTCCNPEFLFSHRASKGKRGNLEAFLQII